MKNTDLFVAIQQLWGKDTTDYPEEWSLNSNRQRGHCGMSSLVVQDYLGGLMLCCDVFVDGDKVGVHYTNQLPDSSIIDLTSEQFEPNELLGPASPIDRNPLQPPRFRADRYEILRNRVAALVGPPD